MKTLERIRSWNVYDNFVLALRLSVGSDCAVNENVEARMPDVISGLLTSKHGTLEVDMEDADAQDDLHLLEAWMALWCVSQLGRPRAS